MTTDFWRRKITRRGALAAGAATGAGIVAIGLAGCGGGGEDKTSGGTSSGLISERKDTTSKAVPGGVYASFRTSDIASMDSLTQANTTTSNLSSYVYSRLFKWKPGVIQPSTGEIEGDLVEKWELNGDATQLSLTLRPNAGTDPRPPLNGRVINAQDVKYSLDRFHQLSAYAPNLFNDKNASAPVLDVQAPDASRVVLKLAFPYAPIYDALAEYLGFYVVPVEADGKFDPRGEAYGSGPWMIKSYQRSSSIEFSRNPNWYLKSKPFLEGISQPIIPEYASQLSQFNAGRIWGGVVRQEDLIKTKSEHPELLLFQGEYGASAPHLYFGWDGPFQDVRLRRAMAMLIDRELFADTFSASEQLTAAGLPKGRAYNSHLGAGWGPFWTDPFGRDLGEGAKYFKLDIAEAKKLVSAAGYANGLDSTFYTLATGQYGTTWHNQMEVLLGMAREGGLRFKTSLEDYATTYIPKYHYSKGAFNGMSASPGGVRSDPGQFLQIFYHSEGSATRTPAGKDPALDSLIDKQLRELDRKKRLEITHDIEKRLADNEISVSYGYQTQSYGLTWPWVGNAGVYRGWVVGADACEITPFLWYDASKKSA